jgi:hypothetical protein
MNDMAGAKLRRVAAADKTKHRGGAIPAAQGGSPFATGV